MSKRKILLIVIGIFLISIVIVIFLIVRNSSSSVPNISNVDRAELSGDVNLVGDFINSNSNKIQLIRSDPETTYQYLAKGDKQLFKTKLELNDISLNDSSQVLWSPDGRYIIVLNETDNSGVINLENGQKISSFIENIKIISPTINNDNYYYYWYVDANNRNYNISKAKIESKDWQKIIDLPNNFLVINLEYIPEKNSVLILGTKVVEDDFEEAKIYTVNAKPELEAVSLDFIPVSLKYNNGYIIIGGVTGDNQNKTYIVNQKDWPNITKADVIPTQDYKVVASNTKDRVGITYADQKGQVILKTYPDKKELPISSFFKKKEYMMPDTDSLNTFDKIEISEIYNLIMFDNNLYIQIGRQIYKSKL